MLGVALVIALAAVGVSVSSRTSDPGAIAPGVAVLSAELGGKSEAEARALLEALATDLSTREVSLVLEGREVRVTPGELSFALDVEKTLASARAAASPSGPSSWFSAWSRARTDVPISFTIETGAFDELVPSWEEALIEDHPFDGAITVEHGVPKADLPRAGRVIDRELLSERLMTTIASGAGGAVAVPVRAVTPTIHESEVRRAMQRAEAILAGPITLTYAPSEEEIEAARLENEQALKQQKELEDRKKAGLPKKKSRMKRKGKRLVEERGSGEKAPTFPMPQPVEVVFSKEDLLSAFRARRIDEPAPPRFEVELAEADVKKKLAPAVAKLFNAARDARFELGDDGRVNIVPSRPGTRVDTSKLVEALYDAAGSPNRTGKLPVDKHAEPKFTTEAAQKLGITKLVSEYTTHHACCQPRVKNIHRICDMLDGAILRPGDTFSVNAAVGPRTVARGFVVAPSIGDGEMTETPGGGVSQFATTLYNALFDGGYVIKERKPHSFYFNRYPMGIEATLSYPSPDLAFMNDTKAALLLRCDYSDTFIRVRLFGDNGGRRVERQVSQPFDYTDPRVELLGNPRREPEDPKTKDHGSHGFSVITTRTITEGDGQKRVERRTVKYTGRPRQIEVHPCEIPKGEKGYTGEKCPKKEEPEGEGGGSG